MPPAASSFVSAGFAALAAGIAALLVVGTGWASHNLGDPAPRVRRLVLRALLGATAWMAVTGAAAAGGVLARFDARPPPIMPFFAGVLAVPVAIGLSGAGERLARGLPVAALVGLQAFRLPLELLMHRAAREGVMPPQMSFSGWNFDVVTGVTAIGVAILAATGRAPRILVVAWNATGMVLLAGIIGLALASSPMIHAFGETPDRLNTFVAYVPFVWLPAVIVAAAILGHVVLTRRLWLDRRPR